MKIKNYNNNYNKFKISMIKLILSLKGKTNNQTKMILNSRLSIKTSRFKKKIKSYNKKMK